MNAQKVRLAEPRCDQPVGTTRLGAPSDRNVSNVRS